MSAKSEVEKMIEGFLIIMLASFLIIIAWNVLRFFLLRFFGYRYYDFTPISCFTAFFLVVVALAPFLYGVHYHAPEIGVMISIITSTMVMIGLWFEARVHGR